MEIYSNEKDFLKPLQLFESKNFVKISAPMVRYSKLAFRKLVRKYDCDLCFTPMIISDSFIQSSKARDGDFTSSLDDHPLIVQFAASNPNDFVNATKLVAPFCEGVDLNCGCPQRWAMQEGYGACLMNKPETVADIVKQTKNITNNEFTVSTKIRIHKDINKTIDFVRKMEAAGVSFITVHGRTKEEKCEPVHLDKIALIKSSLNVPVVANGDVKTLREAELVCKETNVDGIMSARGLLANPALYSGIETTPLECVEDWINISLETGTIYTTFHNHLIYMIDKMQTKSDRKFFNSLNSVPAILTFLKQKYNLNI